MKKNTVSKIPAGIINKYGVNLLQYLYISFLILIIFDGIVKNVKIIEKNEIQNLKNTLFICSVVYLVVQK